MKFRKARHTHKLQEIKEFYMEIIGLEDLGGFEDHDGYEGIFLGFRGSDWHLEFTSSGTPAAHEFDEDDLFVFYTEYKSQFESIQDAIIKHHIPTLLAKNPYWNEKGILIRDPDNFNVVIVPPKS